jgi:hypothetical protein
MLDLSHDVRLVSRRYSRGTLVAVVLVALLKIWLTSGQPLRVMNTDELAFLAQAQGLLSGKWLGDYTGDILVKPPVYALFIALGFLLGMPTLFAQQLTYVLACTLFLVAARPAIVVWRPWKILLLYGLLVFNPMSFLGSPRLLRNHLYTSLTLLLLGCCVAIVLRANRGLRTLVFWSVGCGVALSAVWLTREESLWLIPFLLVFTVLEAWCLWQAIPHRWLSRLLVLGIPYGVLGLSILTISTLNQRYYGIFVANELDQRDFRDAFGAIYRVTSLIPRRPYVVAPKEIRERLYAVSPAFAELKENLEGDMSKPWVTLSCSYYNVCTDNNMGWGFFLWGFREAVLRRGYYDSAVKAASFYRRVAAEINAACDSGKLECTGRRSSLVPPWDNALAWALPGAFSHALAHLATFRGFDLNRYPSEASPEQFAQFSDISREYVTEPTRFSLSGWAVSGRGPIELSVRDGAGQVIEFGLRTVPRPDVENSIKNLGPNVPHAIASGFAISGRCDSNCYLFARSARTDWIRGLPIDGSVRTFLSTPESELARAAGKNAWLVAIERGDIIIYLDDVRRAPDRLFQEWLLAWKQRILHAVGSLYQRVVPILFAVALILFVLHLVLAWRYRAVTPPDLIAFLPLVLVSSRSLALAFTDIVALPRISDYPEYTNAGYPLLLVFTAMLILEPRFRMMAPAIPDSSVSPYDVPASPISRRDGAD